MCWYVRVGKGKRIRMRAAYGAPEFWEDYHAAVDGKPTRSAGKPPGGSLKWLWDKYRESLAWKTFAPATKRARENIMAGVIKNAGHVPFNQVTKAKIAEGRDKRAATPAMAANFVKVMRGMFAWAVEAGIAEIDPTSGVSVKKVKTDGRHTWTLDEIRMFMAKWEIGTRERLAFDLLLFTGLRRGDMVRLGRQHVRYTENDGVRTGIISIKTEKTGEAVNIRLLPILERSINASPTGDMVFFASTFGQPMTKESFGNWFGDVCRKTGVKGSAHGLRKSLAMIFAENGASNKALDSAFGWSNPKTSEIYTRKADRQKMAVDLFDSVDLEQILNNLSPHLNSGEGGNAKKYLKSNT